MSRKTILCLLVFACLAPIACELLQDKGPPIYALVRMRHDASRVELLTLMETFGDTGCDVAIEQFMAGFYEDDDNEEWRRSERNCLTELEPLYQQAFNKEQFHATYLIIEPEAAWEYEARILLFGIPSSQAQEVCASVAKDIGSRFQVKTECVQGTIG